MDKHTILYSAGNRHGVCGYNTRFAEAIAITE